MTAELKQKWIEALESGKYKHGQNYLKKWEMGGAEYCCLGVLADVYNKNGWMGCSWRDRDQEFSDCQLKQFGMTRENQAKLIDINDHDDTKDYSKQTEYIKENL
jgi:hypothetical protein